MTLSNLSFVAYKAAQGTYAVTVQRWVAAALNLSDSTQVQLTSANPTPDTRFALPAVANGTVIVLRLLSPTGAAPLSPLLASFDALFSNSSASRPALPATLAALKAQGLPIGGLFGSCAAVAPPPPLASFSHSVLSQPIAFNIPYAAWRAAPYGAAVQSAVAEALGANTADVQVQQVLPGWRGGTIVRLSFATAFTSSDVGETTSSSSAYAPHELIAFLSLFVHEGTIDGFMTERGDVAAPALAQKLIKYGLPAGTVATYMNEA
jgi:hypothetical protein